MRLTPAVTAEVFRLVEGLGEFDTAAEGAGKALTAAGGPDVVAGCAKALRSKNRFAQRVAVGVAVHFGLPELRPQFHDALNSSDLPVIRGGQEGLSTIGLRKEDVAPLIGVLKRFRKLPDGSHDVVEMAALLLTGVGASAEPALPLLEEILSAERQPRTRESYRNAIRVIKTAVETAKRAP
jgi:hypothetical protein